MIDGVSDAVALAEEVCTGICLTLTKDELLSAGLDPGDFYFRDCGSIWREALSMEVPCPTILMDRDPQLCVIFHRASSRRDISEFNVGVLRVNAELVRRDSARRKRLRELGQEAAAVGRGELAEPWWRKYYEVTG